MASEGHNSEKAAKERRLLFAYYHRKDRDLAAEIRELNEKKKSNRQNAKASGFPAQKLDHYLKSFLAEDQDKPVQKHMSERENLTWLGLIPDEKGGDLLSPRATGEQVIRAKGFEAGLMGADRVSGFMAGSDEDKWWLNSYDEGRKEFETEVPDILARLNVANSKETPPADGDDPFQQAAE